MTDRCEVCHEPIRYSMPRLVAPCLTVTCSICGKRWDERDPGVRYIYATGEWECYEEGPCFDRAAMNKLHEEVQA